MTIENEDISQYAAAWAFKTYPLSAETPLNFAELEIEIRKNLKDFPGPAQRKRLFIYTPAYPSPLKSITKANAINDEIKTRASAMINRGGLLFGIDYTTEQRTITTFAVVKAKN